MARANHQTRPALANGAGTWIQYGNTGATGSRITGVSGMDATTAWQSKQGSSAGGLYCGAEQVPCVAGQPVSATIQFRPSAAGGSVAAQLWWLDSSGNFTGTNATSTAVSAAAGTVYRHVVTGTVPSGAVACKVMAFQGTAAAGATLVATAARVEVGVNDTSLTYADGNTSGWAWNGTAGDSTSTSVLVELVGSAIGVGSGTASVTKPAGAAADGEPASMSFACTAGSRVRVNMIRLKGASSSAPLATQTGSVLALFGGTTSANESSASHTTPSPTWAARSMALLASAVRTTGGTTYTVPAALTSLGVIPSSGAPEQIAGYAAYTSGTSLAAQTFTYNTTSTRWGSTACVVQAPSSGLGVEVLVALVSAESSATLASMTAPSGWTEAASRANPSSLSGVHLKVFYKLVAAAQSQPSWAPSSTATGGTTSWTLNPAGTTAASINVKDDNQQRQDSSGAILTTDPIMPWPPITEPAPWGSTGSCMVMRMGDSRRRNEVQPNVSNWVNGSEYYVGMSIAVDPDFDRFTQNQAGLYQTVWQLRPSNTVGSPPVSLEIGQGNAHLWATGGYGRPGSTSPNYSEYMWSQDLGMAIEPCTWYPIVVYVGVWSDVNSGRFCVWDARTDSLLLDLNPVPCGTNWPQGTSGTSSNDGDGTAWPKNGIYKSGTLRGATYRIREHRQGSSYLAVKPQLDTSEWRAEALARSL